MGHSLTILGSDAVFPGFLEFPGIGKFPGIESNFPGIPGK